MEKICKIVYFDEESVTDYVQIVAGGKLETTTELLNSREADEEQNMQGNAKAGISGVFKALLGWDAGVSANASAGVSFNSTKMAKNIVKNTILTDFLQTIEESSQRKKKISQKNTKGVIKKFKGYNIIVKKDSLSYLVMVSPYLNLIKNGSSIQAGEFNIAIDKVDNVLKNAKGYYEFIGIKSRSKVILRFNIGSFRNGYTISDLLKMDLSIYAIKVGRSSEKNLNVKNELGVDVSVFSKDNPSYDERDSMVDDSSSDEQILDVYDVLLAGVEADD